MYTQKFKFNDLDKVKSFNKSQKTVQVRPKLLINIFNNKGNLKNRKWCYDRFDQKATQSFTIKRVPKFLV